MYWIVSRPNNRECVASIATVEQKPLSKNSSSGSEATAIATTATATTMEERRLLLLRRTVAATTATTRETTTNSSRLNNNNNSQRRLVVAIIQNNVTTATTITMPKTVPKIRPNRLTRTWPWTTTLRRRWERRQSRKPRRFGYWEENANVRLLNNNNNRTIFNDVSFSHEFTRTVNDCNPPVFFFLFRVLQRLRANLYISPPKEFSRCSCRIVLLSLLW